MLAWFLTFALLLGADPDATASEPRVEAWVGHQVLKGKRKIPVYGDKETHTESFLIAEVHRSDRHIEIRQKICRIEVKPIKGVTAGMSQDTVLRLPKSRITIDVKSDGTLSAQPWTSGWETEDIDADGHPGATVQIQGGKCPGEVYATNRTVSRLVSGRATEEGIAGEMAAQVTQKILGASSVCLKLVAGDSEENQTGYFAYRRVPVGANCRNLADKPWPVKAGPP